MDGTLAQLAKSARDFRNYDAEPSGYVKEFYRRNHQNQTLAFVQEKKAQYLTLDAVAQRTREIGVRISLGASRRDVLRSALGGGAIAVLAGTAGGILLALGAQQTLRALVPQLGPLDGGTLIAVAITLSVAGLLACYAPGRRALSIDPIWALREE